MKAKLLRATTESEGGSPQTPRGETPQGGKPPTGESHPPTAAEVIYYPREIERAFGKPPAGPTLLGTDNMANLRVGSGVGAPTRSKHFLRRYHTLKQRVAAGEVVMRHVSDTQMPADFLTKWIPRAKLELSLRYATGSHLRRGQPS